MKGSFLSDILSEPFHGSIDCAVCGLALVVLSIVMS
jgi:hypothetical protein